MSRWEYEVDFGYDEFKNIEEYLQPLMKRIYVYLYIYIISLKSKK